MNLKTHKPSEIFTEAKKYTQSSLSEDTSAFKFIGKLILVVNFGYLFLCSLAIISGWHIIFIIASILFALISGFLFCGFFIFSPKEEKEKCDKTEELLSKFEEQLQLARKFSGALGSFNELPMDTTDWFRIDAIAPKPIETPHRKLVLVGNNEDGTIQFMYAPERLDMNKIPTAGIWFRLASLDPNNSESEIMVITTPDNAEPTKSRQMTEPTGLVWSDS